MDGPGRSLVAELARRSAVVWVAPADAAEDTTVCWYAWHEDALWLVVGGAEQPAGPLHDGAEVTVVLRSRASRSGEAARWSTTAEVVDAQDPRSPAAVAALHAARQSPPDGQDQPQRWERESLVVRLALPR